MANRHMCAVLCACAMLAVTACLQDSNSVRARVQTRLAQAEATAILTPEATPLPTATEAASGWFAVGNTGGDGVYIRRTPQMSDRIVAWPDGTRMQSLDTDEQTNGRLWRKVRDPRGNEGWIPAEYLVLAPAAGVRATPQPAASSDVQELYRRVPDAAGAGVQLRLDLLIVDFGAQRQVSPRLEAQLLDWYLEKAPGRDRYELRVRAGTAPGGQPIERIWRWDIGTRTLRLAETAPPGAPPFACQRWDGMTSDGIRRASSSPAGWGPGASDLTWCGITPPTPTPTTTPTPGPQTPTPTVIPTSTALPGMPTPRPTQPPPAGSAPTATPAASAATPRPAAQAPPGQQATPAP